MTHDGRRTTVAIGHMSDSGELKIVNIVHVAVSST